MVTAEGERHVVVHRRGLWIEAIDVLGYFAAAQLAMPVGRLDDLEWVYVFEQGLRQGPAGGSGSEASYARGWRPVDEGGYRLARVWVA
ncbi:hypothetical protein ACIQ8G_26380 [Streptomyces sp. NPDC094154]|uniref:hypothetical protein n=1 Tax=Streptomyces sp. NPDC094154 TaxID=3366059 RepID=UPI00382E1B6D